jgi:hypothetical protein
MKQIPDLKDARGEQDLSRHPIYRRERENVPGFLNRLRSAATPQDFYEFHRDLLRVSSPPNGSWKSSQKRSRPARPS